MHRILYFATSIRRQESPDPRPRRNSHPFLHIPTPPPDRVNSISRILCIQKARTRRLFEELSDTIRTFRVYAR
jgi:hypothetical protein